MARITKRSKIQGSKPSEMPGFIKPQLATLKAKAPSGDQWLHEIKYDGYRVQIHLIKGKRKVYTRNGLDWTKRFSQIAGALDIPGQAIIDGEVVVVHEGRTNFSELQAELAVGNQDRLVFYAFDLLWRDGDLRKIPQLERKQMLSDLIGENDIEAPVVYSEHLTGNGQKMFEHAAKLGWEGHRLQKSGRALSVGADRGLAESQNRSEGEIPCRWVCEGPDRRCGALPREAGRQGPRLHGQGRDRVEPDHLQPNTKAARYSDQPKIKTDKGVQEAQGNMG